MQTIGRLLPTPDRSVLQHSFVQPAKPNMGGEVKINTRTVLNDLSKWCYFNSQFIYLVIYVWISACLVFQRVHFQQYHKQAMQADDFRIILFHVYPEQRVDSPEFAHMAYKAYIPGDIVLVC